MVVTLDSLTAEVKENLASGNWDYIIWLVENAIELSDETTIKILFPNVFNLPESKLKDVVDARAVIIRRLHLLLNHHAGLLPEEWLLVVSDLSGSFAVSRFVKRMGYTIPQPDLDAIMTKLARVTEQFTLAPFQRQLQAARSRYPNPLPPPL